MADKKYEYDVVTTEDYSERLKYRQNKGWEVYKTDTKIIENRFLFFKKTIETHVAWNIRRDITPIKIKLDLETEVPAYQLKMRKVNIYSTDIIKKIEEQLVKKKLLVKE